MTIVTLEDAFERGLVVSNAEGIYTFSNGTEAECWMSGNCFECRHYDDDTMGSCAFEGAALLGIVSPALALLFGWTQRTTEYGPRAAWEAPDTCRHFSRRGGDDNDERRAPPPHDPRQLVLIADPTEDAAMLAAAHTEQHEHVGGAA